MLSPRKGYVQNVMRSRLDIKLASAFHAAWRNTAMFCRLLGCFVAEELSLVDLKDGVWALAGAGIRGRNVTSAR